MKSRKQGSYSSEDQGNSWNDSTENHGTVCSRPRPAPEPENGILQEGGLQEGKCCVRS